MVKEFQHNHRWQTALDDADEDSQHSLSRQIQDLQRLDDIRRNSRNASISIEDLSPAGLLDEKFGFGSSPAMLIEYLSLASEIIKLTREEEALKETFASLLPESRISEIDKLCAHKAPRRSQLALNLTPIARYDAISLLACRISGLRSSVYSDYTR